MLLVCQLCFGVQDVVDAQNASSALLAFLVESANEDARFLGGGPDIEDIASLSATRLENARLDGDNGFVDVPRERVVGHVSTDILNIEFLVRLRLDVIEHFAKRVR